MFNWYQRISFKNVCKHYLDTHYYWVRVLTNKLLQQCIHLPNWRSTLTDVNQKLLPSSWFLWSSPCWCVLHIPDLTLLHMTDYKADGWPQHYNNRILVPCLTAFHNAQHNCAKHYGKAGAQSTIIVADTCSHAWVFSSVCVFLGVIYVPGVVV